MAVARDQLLDVTATMLADRDFAAHPGEHCAWCSFAHICPEAGRVELADLAVPDDVLF